MQGYAGRLETLGRQERRGVRDVMGPRVGKRLRAGVRGPRMLTQA